MLLLLLGCTGADSEPSVGIGGVPGDTGGTSVERHADGLGFTTRCADATVAVSAVADGVVRVVYGEVEPRDSWAVLPQDPPAVPSIVAYTDVTVLRTDALTVLVDVATCRVRAEDLDGAGLVEDVAETPGRTLDRVLAAGERIYGLGERTGGLDRVGGTYTCRTTDAYEPAEGGWGPDADPLYQCIPFYVSKRGANVVGVLTDNPWTTTWDVGATDPDVFTLQADGGVLDQYLVAGPGFADVLRRYTALTGRPPLPPRWSLGFHQSRWGWSPDTAVTDVVSEFRTRDLPLDAVWLDIQHMRGFRSFTWDPATFPDPAGLVAGLAADGVRAVSIVDPAIKLDTTWDVYLDGAAGGHFLEDPETGDPWVGVVWPGESVFPDFSSPRARDWWGSLAADDLGIGVAGLWLDMNEPSEFTLGTVPDALLADGDGVPTTMAEVHNVYALLEAQATYDGWRAIDPDRRPFLLTRAGYAGIQRHAAAWTGDAPSTWASLQATLPMLLGMSLSGESWIGSDVGGYSGGASGELYARWMQLGAFSPFFRAHLVEGAADQYPWSFGTEVLDISRSVLQLRSTLLPYLYSLAWEAAETGAPPLRPLVWDFPDDVSAETIGDQALLGESVLIAPILDEGATSRTVYLPAGRWFDFYTGVIHDGPATVTLDALPLAALPIFVREGAILPGGPALAFSDAAPLDPLTLEVFPAETPSTFTVYEDAGDGFGYTSGEYAATTWTLQGTATGATLASTRAGTWSPPARTLRVRVRRVDSAPTGVALRSAPLDALDAAEFSRGDEGWWWDAVDLSLWVVISDAPDLSFTFTYNPAISDPAPPVAMPFRVTLPAGTPSDTPITIASSADDWATHTPLTRVSATEAAGTLTVPRGEWLYYKYARGSWETVEKWPACEEASNRYALGRADEKADTVYGWRDWCGE
jgi:alpha-glucosidase